MKSNLPTLSALRAERNALCAAANDAHEAMLDACARYHDDQGSEPLWAAYAAARAAFRVAVPVYLAASNRHSVARVSELSPKRLARYARYGFRQLRPTS